MKLNRMQRIGRSRPRSFRCPYCVEGSEFKLMVRRESGQWYLCPDCGHLAMAENPEFKCPCAKCATLNLENGGHRLSKHRNS
jgi:predicted RNA-binding Zn-ribbon protein involved in translation (DUF1610 family)